MKIIFMTQIEKESALTAYDRTKLFAFLSADYDCCLFMDGQGTDSLEDEAKQMREWLSQEENLVLYFYFGEWKEGERLLASCRANVLIRYYGITPEHFYQEYSPLSYLQCRTGRNQGHRLAKRKDFYWAPVTNDSRTDFKEVMEERIKVIPPFLPLAEWKTTVPEDGIVTGLLNERRVHLLYAGEQTPESGLFFLMEVLNCYNHAYGKDIHLYCVGRKKEGLELWTEALEQASRYKNVTDQITFIDAGPEQNHVWLSYYLGCDCTVCVSEHAGFPDHIVHAQALSLPVIGRSSSSIPETAGREQILLGQDYYEYAAAIHTLVQRQDYQEALIEKGHQNVLRFRDGAVMEAWKQAISCILEHSET